MSPWLVFFLSAGVIILAGSRLSRDGDVIAERTGMGGAWVGAILVAGATSLPELATNLAAVRQGYPNLAMGNLFGACMANMLTLGIADLVTTQVRVLTRVAINQVLLGVLAMSLVALTVAGAVAHLNVAVLNLGWGTLAVGLGYVLGMRLISVNRDDPPFETQAAAEESAPTGSLRSAVIGFAVAALALFGVAPFLADSASDIAELLGISRGFAGMVLLALTTTLPEFVVSISSIRAGAYDMAVGNLLGSNCFNMAILAILDLAEGPGPMLAQMEGGLLVGAAFAILLIGQAVMGVLNKSERRVWFLEPDAVFLVLTYGVGLYLTYRVGG